MASEPIREKPDPRVLMVWGLSSAVSFGILFLIVALPTLFMWFLGRGPSWILAVTFSPVALWLLSLLTLNRQWNNWWFCVTPEALEMNHGWIWQQRRVVARDRIQHLDINSGPLDRRFGLVQVVVHTAGTTVGMIPGLKPERAEALRAELMEGREIA